MASIKNYDEISKLTAQGQTLNESGYSTLTNPRNGFIQVNQNGFRPELNGWKFHISTTAEDLPQAWELVSDILMEEGIGVFKVTKPETAQQFDNPNNPQTGKQITIYGTNNDGADMARIAERIETVLRENGIESGHDVNGDKTVQGSHYIHYRNDRSPTGSYVSAEDIRGMIARGEIDESQAHNPYNQDDPLASIDLTNAGKYKNTEKNTTEHDWQEYYSSLKQGNVMRLEVSAEFTDAKELWAWLVENNLRGAEVATKGSKFFIYVSENNNQKYNTELIEDIDTALTERQKGKVSQKQPKEQQSKEIPQISDFGGFDKAPPGIYQDEQGNPIIINPSVGSFGYGQQAKSEHEWENNYSTTVVSEKVSRLNVGGEKGFSSMQEAQEFLNNQGISRTEAFAAAKGSEVFIYTPNVNGKANEVVKEKISDAIVQRENSQNQSQGSWVDRENSRKFDRENSRNDGLSPS